MKNPTPIIITGPTASGKSTFAEQLCDILDGVIINADSLQIYRGVTKLTAQPTLQKERHFLYSSFNPPDKCDVAQWLELAQSAILHAQNNGKRPIIVGGTGFYIKVLLEGISSIPIISNTVIQQADQLIGLHGLQYLYEDLKLKDPHLPSHIRLNDAQRIIRAWTVLEATGKPLQEWYKIPKPRTSPFIKVLCMHDRDILYERINQRFASMWTNGIVEEIQVFHSTHNNIVDNYAAKAIGFTEVVAYLEGSLMKQEAIERAQTKTRQYAKRQLTWFRHQFEADAVVEGPKFNVDKVLNFCHKTETYGL